MATANFPKYTFRENRLCLIWRVVSQQGGDVETGWWSESTVPEEVRRKVCCSHWQVLQDQSVVCPSPVHPGSSQTNASAPLKPYHKAALDLWYPGPGERLDCWPHASRAEDAFAGSASNLCMHMHPISALSSSGAKVQIQGEKKLYI